MTVADFPAGYWNSLWGWYNNGGEENVAAYLGELDISGFDAKAPPLKTPAFWSIVDANRAPESLNWLYSGQAGTAHVPTLIRVLNEANGSFEEWIRDRRNRRVIRTRSSVAVMSPFATKPRPTVYG